MRALLQRRARVILVGSGRMGQIRASLLYSNPRFDLCGIVDVDFPGAVALAEKYSAKPFKSLKEAIEELSSKGSAVQPVVEFQGVASPAGSASSVPSLSSIDGVVISTPTFTHESIIKEAAKNGLSIFTEKPVDETSDKIVALFDLCEKYGVQLCCGFQRRFDESYVATARAVQSGKIGKPLTSTIFFADHPCPPVEFLLTGGNIFMDLSAHDVDYIRWVLDDEVVSVYATGTSSRKVLEEAGVHDNATMVMKFQKGAVVILTLSRSACYGYDQRCEVFGDKGLATVGNVHAHTGVVSDVDGVHQSRLKHSFPERFNRAFATELDAFADTLLLHTPWPVDANDCIAVQKVADAARKSCELNQVVEVSRQDFWPKENFGSITVPALAHLHHAPVYPRPKL